MPARLHLLRSGLQAALDTCPSRRSASQWAEVAAYLERARAADFEVWADGPHLADLLPLHRGDWLAWCDEQVAAADDACAGHLVRPGHDVGPRGLWSGPARVAVHHASEELVAWWTDDPRRRQTYRQWCAWQRGRPDPSWRRWTEALDRWSVERGAIRSTGRRA